MTPTPEQAVLFARMLDAGVPAEEAIGYCAPGMEEAEYPVYAERWPRLKAVRDARIALQENTDWLAMSQKQRMDRALELAYNSMAYYLVTHPVAEQETGAYKKALTFIDLLEKKGAGTAGAVDPMEAFFKRFKDKETAAAKKVTSVKGPEAVQ